MVRHLGKGLFPELSNLRFQQKEEIMSGSEKEKRPIELRADRLRREARERRLGLHEMTKDEEVDLLGKVFAESIGHDLGFLCMLPAPDDKSKPIEDVKPAAKRDEASDPPSLKPEEVAGWGNVTGHGC